MQVKPRSEARRAKRSYEGRAQTHNLPAAMQLTMSQQLRHRAAALGKQAAGTTAEAPTKDKTNKQTNKQMISPLKASFFFRVCMSNKMKPKRTRTCSVFKRGLSSFAMSRGFFTGSVATCCVRLIGRCDSHNNDEGETADSNIANEVWNRKHVFITRGQV